jgi:hypothetical protein
VLLFQSLIIVSSYKKHPRIRKKKVKLFLLSQRKKNRIENETPTKLFIQRKINSCSKLAFIVVDDDVRSSQYFSATTAYT